MAESEVFLKGQPLNVTDIEVGPDGAIYFCNVAVVPPEAFIGSATKVKSQIEFASSARYLCCHPTTTDRIRLGSPAVAAAAELAGRWGQLVAGVALSNDTHYRTRAIDLMLLFGPVPNEKLLLELSTAPNEQVRSKAAWMMGLHPGSQSQEKHRVTWGRQCSRAKIRLRSNAAERADPRRGDRSASPIEIDRPESCFCGDSAS